MRLGILETPICRFSHQDGCTRLYRLIADMVLEHNNSIVGNKSEKAFLIQDQKKIQTQIDNFLEAIGNGISTMSTKIKLEKLEQELAEGEHKLVIAESRERIKISREEITKFISQSIRKEPKMMIKTLVNKIILYEDKVEIYFNYTNRKSPDDDSRGFLFMTTQSNILKPITNTKKEMCTMLVKIYII